MNKQKHFYIIEENIKNPKMFELKTFTTIDKYIRFNQNSLKDFLWGKSFKTMLKNGLFMTKKDRTYNASISIQRLVGCLYSDITGMEMHHINKDKTNNTLYNLVPLESDVNTSIDSLPFNEMQEFGRKEHQKWIKSFNKKRRNTVANNPLLIIDILSNSIGKTTKAVHTMFKKKIKSIKVIRNILNIFFYAEEFLKYLEKNNISIYDN